jgi:D-glycero-D-manno-heptose 1,7-bisphosphate phosphatase
MQPAVFFDRDGVLNKAIIKNGKPYPPTCLDEFEIMDKAYEKLKALKEQGYFLAVITNQPDVARGKCQKEDIEKLNSYIKDHLPINVILTCYHDSVDNCKCRKPEPGFLLDLSETYQLDLKKSFLIGDRWKDIEAGQRVNCKTIFIDYHYNEKRPVGSDYEVSNLEQATNIILQKK